MQDPHAENYCKGLEVITPVVIIRGEKLNKLKISTHLLRSFRELRPQSNSCSKSRKDKRIPRIPVYWERKPITRASICTKAINGKG